MEVRDASREQFKLRVQRLAFCHIKIYFLIARDWVEVGEPKECSATSSDASSLALDRLLPNARPHRGFY